MTNREMDAAEAYDPALRAAYAECRRLNARHGRTYFLATRLLPLDRRSAVHALYGFARRADDIVDENGSASAEERAAALDVLEAEWRRALRGQAVADPTVTAAAHTRERLDIPARHFDDFLASMRSDLFVREYATYADLRAYMHGSAAVIGLQMVPVLGTVVPREEAEPYAAALGIAFQLTNFLRDVGEDLDRGRVYLPADLLAASGVDGELLRWSRRTGSHDRRITEALRAAASLTRGVYRDAEPGIDLLEPVSAPCVRAAFVLYRDILAVIEKEGYPVVHRRAVVGARRRASIALPGLARAWAARAGWRTGAPAAGGGPGRTASGARSLRGREGTSARERT
ncbi:phytoene/squalene synthase family protein [Streptomyces omiyaensis]|uniref:phytoene/squalene synthase family protein n=1 Tax=Streptomyces omiyaensis TaxID=68247 RepID=UPI0036FAF6CC